MGQLFESSPGKEGLQSEEQVQGSGGGGPIEAVWWSKDEGVQWRIKGRAFVVGMDMDSENDSGVRTVKSEVGGRMRVMEGKEGGEGQWSWGREITGHFGSMSPGMRGISDRTPSAADQSEDAKAYGRRNL